MTLELSWHDFETQRRNGLLRERISQELSWTKVEGKKKAVDRKLKSSDNDKVITK